MAKEQAVVGVCFAGVQRLKKQGICPPMPLYMQWLGATSWIQLRNEEMNRWSLEICEKIEADGYSCCVLKGQAVAGLYMKSEKGTTTSEKTGQKSDDMIDLRMLRQSGDIDAWMLATHKEVILWGQQNGGVWFYDYHHADLMGFHDVEVELHYRPTLSRNLWRNVRLQRWINTEKNNLISNVKGEMEYGFPVPSPEFSLILTLNHNFWHLLYEGVGMRQMMDLYFILLTQKEQLKVKNKKWARLVNYFGLTRFARASMWVMKEVFGLENEYMMCEPDERSGRFLLREIIQGGNFGHADTRLHNERYKSRFALMLGWMRHTWRLFRYYPADVLWTPFGVLYISLWRRWHYRFDKIRLDEKK